MRSSIGSAAHLEPTPSPPTLEEPMPATVRTAPATPVTDDDVQRIADGMRAFSIAANKHVGGACSSAEMTAALMFGGEAHFSLERSNAGTRDDLVLSKGHAPAAYYYGLWLHGFFGDMEVDELLRFGDVGHRLPRMPRRDPARGIDMGTGALGQGLSFANGLAIANRAANRELTTYVILGDAECGEGQVWEAAATAVQCGLRSVVGLLDVNGFGSGVPVPRDRWSKKWDAFGWEVHEVDGHDVSAIRKALHMPPADRPRMLLLNTIKGKGLVGPYPGTNRVHSTAPDEARPAVDLGAHAEFGMGFAAERYRLGAEPVWPRHLAPLKVDASMMPSSDVGTTFHTKKIAGELSRVIEANPGLMFVTPDAVGNSGLQQLFASDGSWTWDRSGSRILECPIAEQDAASIAAGLAAGGRKPLLCLMEGFVWRMLDSLRQSINFAGLPVTVIGTSGGIGDSLGSMVQSDSAYAAITAMPGLECFEATDINEAALLLEEALRTDGPTYVRLPHEPIEVRSDPADLRSRTLEDGAWVIRSHDDPHLTLVSAGSLKHVALDVADELERTLDVRANVVDVFSVTRFAKSPEVVRRAMIPASQPALSVHNAPSRVLGIFLPDGGDALGLDGYGDSGKPIADLYRHLGLGHDAVLERAKALLLAG